MDVTLTPTERRAGSAALAASALAHLLAPGALLRIARWAYDRTFDVAFRPRSGARRRVRLVGAGMLALAAVIRRRSDRN